MTNEINLRRSLLGLSGGLILSVAMSAPVQAVGLENLVRKAGQASREELCLVANRAMSGNKGGFFGDIDTLFTKVKTTLFGDSLYCGKNLIYVLLITGDQIDSAVVEASSSLKSAYEALGAKQKDMRDLARIQKQSLGEKFGDQAVDRTERNIKVINSYAQRLQKEIEAKKDFLSDEARAALVEAISRFDAAIYYQTKSAIGAYLAVDSVRSNPKQIKIVALHGKKFGLTPAFFNKTLTRLPEALLNFGRGFETALTANEVMDESEKEAIEEGARRHVEAAKERNLTVSQKIEAKSSFPDLPAADGSEIKAAGSASPTTTTGSAEQKSEASEGENGKPKAEGFEKKLSDTLDSWFK